MSEAAPGAQRDAAPPPTSVGAREEPAELASVHQVERADERGRVLDLDELAALAADDDDRRRSALARTGRVRRALSHRARTAGRQGSARR